MFELLRLVEWLAPLDFDAGLVSGRSATISLAQRFENVEALQGALYATVTAL
jgi:hypothetical protein